jgi:HAE1 family hydrophobic/amphiphilic exporter-1
VELTNWADQVLKKRLENVRGVGSVTLVGGTKREINIYLNPQAMEALASRRPGGGGRAQREPGPAAGRHPLAAAGARGADRRPHAAPEDFGRIIVARKNGAGALGQVARRVDGAQEVDSLALYNGSAPAADGAEVQGENTIEVVDGLKRVAGAASPAAARRALEPITDGSRPIRVSVANVRRTLIEGALLTVLIVFLFLNSWRSTVITGLTLPIALIGTFIVHVHVRLHHQHDHADGAEPVRGPADRRRHRGAREHRAPCADGQDRPTAALDGTQEIGLAVLATTLSIVAVFLPIGFMGGIIGKFFHEFGITIVAAVLISMFVSFTLDPMLSSVWHDPSIDAHGTAAQPVTLYDKTIGRVTAGSTAPPSGWPTATSASCAGRWCTSSRPWALATGHLCGSVFMVPHAGHRIRAQGRLFRDQHQLLHAGGFVAGGDRSQGAPGRGHHARVARGALHLSPPSTPATPQGKIYASLCAPGGPQGPQRSVDEMSGCCASACASRCPASPSPMWACSIRWAATSRLSFRSRGRTCRSWSA